MKLKRSNDRKVANAVSPNGKTPTIANTFGLPAGKDYSCPGATSVCESVCYAGKLERIYKGVRDNLLHNWNLLKDADHDTMEALLSEMIADFRKDCEKKNAKLLFRIHWDGDFFNDTYTLARVQSQKLLLLLIPKEFRPIQTMFLQSEWQPLAKCVLERG